MNDGNETTDGAESPERLRATLERYNLSLRRGQELAEAWLAGLNRQLRELHRSGLVGAVAVPGPMLLCRPYPAGGPEDSGQCVQAALALPAGLGVIYWDSEEAAQLLADHEFFGREAGRRVVPFEDCEPALRALLAPHAASLVTELLGQVRFRDA